MNITPNPQVITQKSQVAIQIALQGTFDLRILIFKQVCIQLYFPALTSFIIKYQFRINPK